MKGNYILNNILFLVLLVNLAGCNKLVSIPEPINTITTSEAFSTSANATSAIMGIYGQLYGRPFLSSNISQYAGISSDELENFDTYNLILTQFQTNTIQAIDASQTCASYFWTPMYSVIYKTNAAIEGLAASKSIPASVKGQLTGEAKFIRAFCYFYLTNLFGDAPLVTTTAWENARTLHKAPSGDIYTQIIADLKDAKELLTNDYTFSGDERTRANKWVASALLARVYLYNKDWADAEKESSAVIDSSGGIYGLDQDLTATFLKNSTETIWQLEVANQFPYATNEANQFVPPDQMSNPNYYLSTQFLAAIDSGDQRKTDWIDSTVYDDGTGPVTYYYPFKYKVKRGSEGDIAEYVMVLRLAEQYLIRAEARAQNNKPDNAVADLNIIRGRAHLTGLPTGLSQSEVLSAVAQERRIELFSEWGHRWLDLKRTSQADAVLSPIKPQWQGYQKLYPIPLTELQSDPNLTQNDGY